MIIVDTSVWVDYFNGREGPHTDRLHALLGNEPIAIGDLILTEILQGFRDDLHFRQARELLMALSVFEMLGVENALRCAEHYRGLRKRGITIRKTVDVIIATFCIVEDHTLLFSDRDFLPFVKHLGLRSLIPTG